MSEAFWIAIIGFASRFGINAAIEILSTKGSTREDAIAALRRAEALSLEQIISEDAAKRGLPTGQPEQPLTG